ncbi:MULTISPECIES: hypothetical protein [unclassified Microcoleus]|uniref:hypothetical protein n=1 Tax=unclassified Microcoleus TaxID=2642155 RepID=UPI002FD460EE
MSEIQNERAKEFLLKAEGLMEQEKYAEAISYATAGLEIMFERANDFFFDQSFFRFDRFKKLNEIDSIKGIYVEKSSNKSEVSSKLKEGIKALKDGVQHSVDRIQGLDETTICYCLGISIEQYVRYRKMAGYFYAMGVEFHRKPGTFGTGKLDFDKKDAEVSLHYCAKTIKNIEETLERLNKPLSEE